MSVGDNTELNPGISGDRVRDIQKGGASGPKTQVVAIDAGGSGAESLVDPTNGLPVVMLAGSALVGKVGIDQTTPGTTNAVVARRETVTQVVSTALEASKVLKSSAGSLVSLTVTNTKTSAQWILLMNSTTVPGDGAVTLLCPPIPIAAQSMVVIDWDTPLGASTGIAVSNSSTGTFTKTIGSADCAFHAQVI